MRLVLLCVLAFLTSAGSYSIDADVFEPALIPKGAKVTIAQPAITEVPIGMLVNFDATDRAQALQFRPVVVGAKGSVALKLYIYDSTEKEVRVIDVPADSNGVFYNFKSLHTVSVRPELANERLGSLVNVKLLVESNRPATIYH